MFHHFRYAQAFSRIISKYEYDEWRPIFGSLNAYMRDCEVSSFHFGKLSMNHATQIQTTEQLHTQETDTTNIYSYLGTTCFISDLKLISTTLKSDEFAGILLQ